MSSAFLALFGGLRRTDRDAFRERLRRAPYRACLALLASLIFGHSGHTSLLTERARTLWRALPPTEPVSTLSTEPPRGFFWDPDDVVALAGSSVRIAASVIGEVKSCSTQSWLPPGFELRLEGGTCVLAGTAPRVSEEFLTHYSFLTSACGAQPDECTAATLSLKVVSTSSVFSCTGCEVSDDGTCASRQFLQEDAEISVVPGALLTASSEGCDLYVGSRLILKEEYGNKFTAPGHVRVQARPSARCLERRGAGICANLGSGSSSSACRFGTGRFTDVQYHPCDRHELEACSFKVCLHKSTSEAVRELARQSSFSQSLVVHQPDASSPPAQQISRYSESEFRTWTSFPNRGYVASTMPLLIAPRVRGARQIVQVHVEKPTSYLIVGVTYRVGGSVAHLEPCMKQDFASDTGFASRSIAWAVSSPDEVGKVTVKPFEGFRGTAPGAALATREASQEETFYWSSRNAVEVSVARDCRESDTSCSIVPSLKVNGQNRLHQATLLQLRMAEDMPVHVFFCSGSSMSTAAAPRLQD